MKYNFFLVLICVQFITFWSLGQNPNAEVISFKETIEVGSSRIIKEYFYEIKINNRIGDEYAEVAIRNGGTSSLHNLDGELLNKDKKRIRRLRNKDIETSGLIEDFSLYEDNTVTEFNLKHTSYPYYIRYSYKQKTKDFVHVTSWTPVVYFGIPTRKAELKITTTTDLPLNIYENMIEYKRFVEDKKIHYLWKSDYTKQIYSEEFIPSLDELVPYVKVSPVKFEFEEYGSFESWTDFGQWQLRMMNGLGELTESEKHTIDELIKSQDSKLDKLKVLYHYLQDNTRYVNVSIETGGLIPYPASYVCQNQYGDCKALTNYFKSVLKYAGINSFYANVYAGSQINKVEKSFLGSQFNHVIMMVPLEKDTVWLDCTSSGPFNYLGSFTQSRNALILKPGGSHFLKTPAFSPSEVMEVREAEIDYRFSGKANLKVFKRFRGEKFEQLNSLEKQVEQRYQKKYINKYFTEAGIELEGYSIDKKHRDSAFIDLNYQAYSDQVYEKIGDNLLVKIFSFNIPAFEKVSDRKLPLSIPFPIHKKDSLVYKLPYAYKAKKEILNMTIKSQFGEFKKRIVQNENRLIVVKSLLINGVETDLESYADFYDFLQQVQKSENKNTFLINKN